MYWMDCKDCPIWYPNCSWVTQAYTYYILLYRPSFWCLTLLSVQHQPYSMIVIFMAMFAIYPWNNLLIATFGSPAKKAVSHILWYGCQGRVCIALHNMIHITYISYVIAIKWPCLRGWSLFTTHKIELSGSHVSRQAKAMPIFSLAAQIIGHAIFHLLVFLLHWSELCACIM